MAALAQRDGERSGFGRAVGREGPAGPGQPPVGDWWSGPEPLARGWRGCGAYRLGRERERLLSGDWQPAQAKSTGLKGDESARVQLPLMGLDDIEKKASYGGPLEALNSEPDRRRSCATGKSDQGVEVRVQRDDRRAVGQAPVQYHAIVGRRQIDLSQPASASA